MSNAYGLLRRLISDKKEYGQYSSGAWPSRVRAKAAELLSGKTGKLLDAGCGEGIFTITLAKTSPLLKITGIDHDDTRLSQCRETAKKNGLSNLEFIDHDITATGGYYLSGFDYAVCINTLFNLNSSQDVEKTLTNISGCLKKNGIAVFDFRNSGNILVNLKYATAPLYDKTIAEQNISLKTYSLKEMTRMTKSSGLNIKNIFPLGMIKNNLAPIIMIEAQKC